LGSIDVDLIIIVCKVELLQYEIIKKEVCECF